MVPRSLCANEQTGDIARHSNTTRYTLVIVNPSLAQQIESAREYAIARIGSQENTRSSTVRSHVRKVRTDARTTKRPSRECGSEFRPNTSGWAAEEGGLTAD